MMVVEGATGKVLGDIPNTPGVHGAGSRDKAGTASPPTAAIRRSRCSI
jgi:hypothetical protein